MRISRTLVAGACLAATPLCLAGPTRAAEANTVSTRPSGEALAPPVVKIVDGAMGLELSDAIEVALGRNLGLVGERYNRESFRLQIDQAFGIYDLGLNGTATISDSSTPAASNLDGAEVSTRKNQALNLGVSQLFPWGGSVSGTWSNSRSESNSSFALLNPSFSVGLDGEYRQPLLRNFGRDNTEYRIRLAQIDSKVGRESFERAVVSVIQQVTVGYWELVEARAQVDVAEESLALARQLHDINKVRVDVGTLAPLELIQSEAGIAIRQEEIIRARARVGDAEDSLRRLLGFDDGDLWDVAIVPQSRPASERFVIDVDAAWKLALDKRAEVRSQRLSLERTEVGVAYSEGQTKPQLDLVVGYGFNGIGGDSAIRCDSFAVSSGLCQPEQIGEIIGEAKGGWDDAAEQVAKADFDDWRIQLSFAMPLQNTTAKATAALARLDADRSRVALRDLEQGILTEVRKATRGVTTAAQQIDSARVSRELAEKNLEAEQKRYDNGLSTSFQVLEIQEDLSQARSREITAVAAYERAVAEYRRATGTLLEASGVELADE